MRDSLKHSQPDRSCATYPSSTSALSFPSPSHPASVLQASSSFRFARGVSSMMVECSLLGGEYIRTWEFHKWRERPRSFASNPRHLSKARHAAGYSRQQAIFYVRRAGKFRELESYRAWEVRRCMFCQEGREANLRFEPDVALDRGRLPESQYGLRHSCATYPCRTLPSHSLCRHILVLPRVYLSLETRSSRLCNIWYYSSVLAAMWRVVRTSECHGLREISQYFPSGPQQLFEGAVRLAARDPSAYRPEEC